ncbi:NADPH:adrenodoxin oxidoreductase, mitochondrial [Tetrabaena socialis]|uniref:NADPH:adrenodoxin oxidoreductase, mitochondrial n=1 Tax=Tetrabaena socialis TaxID=47790 RepID=A0A2J7ZPE4_9CHLO|nr:NADPH:adrenodoxin oxidoreductase, mitochondrial [Tetrabaena socialis]|eukprot:PNH02136.1 NADPH:adrenodoxin oxidoreductase, mitochondrial [Tetrabaena socialis]
MLLCFSAAAAPDGSGAAGRRCGRALADGSPTRLTVAIPASAAWLSAALGSAPRLGCLVSHILRPAAAYATSAVTDAADAAGGDTGKMHVCVVGSGPAGFYTVDRLLKGYGDKVQVTLLDRLPTPFGLVRSGVAPDHQDTKNVIRQFSDVAADPRVTFLGNVAVGRDVELAELRRLHHAVVLSYGAESDRRLGIPGEAGPGVLSAREFVWWYNGHPDARGLQVDLSQASGRPASNRRLRVERTVVRPERPGGAPMAVGSGEFDTIPCQLLLQSVGFKSLPLQGVPFDPKRGVVPNVESRVPGDGPASPPATEPRLYVVGWLKRGPTGIIGTNAVDAKETASAVAADTGVLRAAAEAQHGAGGPAGGVGLAALLAGRGVRAVGWGGWLALDEHEVAAGRAAGRVREKVTEVGEMLRVCGV